MLEIGSLAGGKYKVLNKVGQGGMSNVYLAMNEKANKQWAIKEVRSDNVENFEIMKQSLRTETELLRKLHHPNLPSIVDIIEEKESFLIVMDYIEGRHLEKVVCEYGPQSQKQVIAWAKQLCSVLFYLHTRTPPIIYRDMKPSNIMLKPDGGIMLIDFGTAREFKQGEESDTTCLGTQGYAAPEQYGGNGQTDCRTDIYCLGATLYYLLTGHNPGEPPYEIYPIRYWKPELSSGLEKIILKCTQKNPEDRYQSCGELMYALEHYCEMDAIYEKKQTFRLKSFAVCVWMMFLSGISAIGFHVAEKRTLSLVYESCLEEAASMEETDYEKCVQNYEAAIELNPRKGEAYEKLLKFFIWQDTEKDGMVRGACVFSEKEEKDMRRILGMTENGKRNEDFLRKTPEDYERFAYDLGIAYFYLYNGVGNKAASKKWLEIAAEGRNTEKLCDTDIKRAKKLYEIADYYYCLGIRNQAGSTEKSYADFWEDLIEIAETESYQEGNYIDNLFLYRELAVQITANAFEFKRAGITKEEMQTQLERTEQVLDVMQISANKIDRDYEQELKTEVRKDINIAKESLLSVFNTCNFKNVMQGGAANATD